MAISFFLFCTIIYSTAIKQALTSDEDLITQYSLIGTILFVVLLEFICLGIAIVKTIYEVFRDYKLKKQMEQLCMMRGIMITGINGQLRREN